MTQDINKVTPYNSQDSKKSQVEDMFDNIAPKYDLLNHVLSMKIDVMWRNTLGKMLKIEQPQEVLDVATGTGDLAIAVQKGSKAKVVGLDLSQQMLNVGVIKIKKLNLDGDISMQKGDAENLPFSDNRFDTKVTLLILRTQAMLTTANRPETDILSSNHVSTAMSRNDTPKTTITFMLFRTQWLCA